MTKLDKYIYSGIFTEQHSQTDIPSGVSLWLKISVPN